MIHFEKEDCNAPQGSSATDTQRVVRRLWLELLKTSVFVFAVVAVIVIECFAWFVSNNRIQAGGASVSARGRHFRLATKGERQTVEYNLLRLEQGTEYTYGGETYYYTEDEHIALRLSEEDIVVSPGASGAVKFYIIPTQDGAMSVTLYVNMEGYVKESIGDTLSAKTIDDSVLKALLSGHILLFHKLEDGHYSEWLGMGNSFTVTLPEDTEKDVPVPVTIYWIWPLRYENMVDDLYVKNSEEYQNIFKPYVEEQSVPENMAQITQNNYRYSRVFLTNEKALSDTNSRSNAYNLADEYIGTKADYLYLAIKTTSY